MKNMPFMKHKTWNFIATVNNHAKMHNKWFLLVQRIAAKINNLQFFAVFYTLRNIFQFWKNKAQNRLQMTTDNANMYTWFAELVMWAIIFLDILQVK